MLNVLICGAGRVARHLLKRLGEGWQVTLLDKAAERLEGLPSDYHIIQRIVAADASSPVVLDNLKVGAFDYVLALTNDDDVNLAIVSHAKSRGVQHVFALVNEQPNQPQFDEIGVMTVLGGATLAKTIYHYLQDPRIKVVPISSGQADFLEVDVSHHFRMVGKRASQFMKDEWRLAAIIRHGRLFFPRPETIIESGDRAVILGRGDIFKPVCDILECGHPHFPSAYGHGMVVALPEGSDHGRLVEESVYFGRNTKVGTVTLLCSPGEPGIEELLKLWSQNIDMDLHELEGDRLKSLQEVCQEGHCGIAVIDPLKGSFFNLLMKPLLISLAQSLPCPLLVARHTDPYERILVPFHGTPGAELALEVAVDLGKQLGAEVCVVVVEEPEVIHGTSEADWLAGVVEKIRDIGHIHKIELTEIVRRGNPVREVMDVAPGFDLMVIGSGTREKRLFTPHVGELLAENAPCSVLIVTN